MDSLGQNGASSRLIEPDQPLHYRRNQGDFIPGHRTMFLDQELVKCRLYGIGFVSRTRRERLWQRSKGMVVSVLFKQEPSRLLKPTFIRRLTYST